MEKQFNSYLSMLQGERLQGEGGSISVNGIKVVRYNEARPFYLNEGEFKDKEFVEILRSYNYERNIVAAYVEEYK